MPIATLAIVVPSFFMLRPHPLDASSAHTKVGVLPRMTPNQR
jgi:hypothetical protein